jgi:hypothetical protein
MQLYFFCDACEHQYLPSPQLTQIDTVIPKKIVSIITACPYCGEKSTKIFGEEYQENVKLPLELLNK